jgi:hypothetical protein
MPAQSKSEEVGDMAKAAVDAIGILKPGVVPDAAVPSVKRKTPSVPEGDTLGLPQFVISVGEEGKVERLDAVTKIKAYPVAATIVTGTGAKAADDATVRKWRQQFEEKLEAAATWAGLAGFNRVNITNKAPFDVNALSKDFNYATVVAEVEVVEEHADGA